MTINRIAGTIKQDSGGGGLGKFLGSLIGGGAGFLLGGPGGALKGASLGGGAGGMIGGAVNPAEQKNMGVGQPTEAAMQIDKPKTSVLDRLNAISDIGQTVAGIDFSGTPKAGLKMPSGLPNSALNRRFDYMSGRIV